MPVREITEAEVNAAINSMAPRLVFLLEERRVPRPVIAAVGGDDVLTVAQFAKTGRNEEGFYSWLEEDLGIKVSDQGGRSLQARMADAWEAAKRHKEEAETMAGRTRAMGLQPELQKGDQVALRKQYRELAGTIDDEEYPSYSYLNNRLEELEEGELVAETLDEVTTRQMELRQPADHLGGIAWNKKGEPILKKGKVRGSLPTDTEGYRRAYRIMKHHWALVRLRQGDRPFLRGLDGDFWATRVEQMLGREIFGYSVRDELDRVIVKLSRPDFLNFDQEVRKRAIRQVNETQITLAEAVNEARKDTELRTKFLVQRLAVAHLLPRGIADSGATPLPPRGPKRLQLEDYTPRLTTGNAGSSTDGAPERPKKQPKKKGGKGGGKGKGAGKSDKDDAEWKRISLARKMSRNSPPGDGKGICWSYNKAAGCQNPSCNFHHLCLFCGRSHPLDRCVDFDNALKANK